MISLHIDNTFFYGLFCIGIPVSTTQCSLKHKLIRAIDYRCNQVKIRMLAKGIESDEGWDVQ